MTQPTTNSTIIEIPDYAQIRDSFYDELVCASRGEPTSLPFIRNQLPESSLVNPSESFQVFVIGGTNGETATVQYTTDGAVTIIDHQAHPELAKFKVTEDFLSFIDTHIKKTTRVIGINFAVALLPVTGEKSQLDGILIEGDTKGHGFRGLQQERVGATIEQHFRQTHNRDLVVSVGNDTVCLLASGAARGVERDTLVAGIVGTGYNMALFLDDKTIVNVQSSDFTGFNTTPTGKIVDLESANPGEQLYNKEIAAGQLFKHYNALLRELALKGQPLQSTKELAALAIANQEKEGEVARALFQRSASLVAAHFAGLYNYKGRPARLTAVMQGGLFWDGPNYKAMVTAELTRLGVPGSGIIFEKVEYSDILGAAMLVTGGL